MKKPQVPSRVLRPHFENNCSVGSLLFVLLCLPQPPHTKYLCSFFFSFISYLFLFPWGHKELNTTEWLSLSGLKMHKGQESLPHTTKGYMVAWTLDFIITIGGLFEIGMSSRCRNIAVFSIAFQVKIKGVHLCPCEHRCKAREKDKLGVCN